MEIEEGSQIALEDKDYQKTKELAYEIRNEILAKYFPTKILEAGVDNIEPSIDSIKQEGKPFPEIIHKGWKVTLSFVVPKSVIGEKTESADIIHRTGKEEKPAWE